MLLWVWTGQQLGDHVCPGSCPPLVSLEFPWVLAQAARLGRALSGSLNCVTLCDSRDPREGSQAGTVRLRSSLAEAPRPCSAIAAAPAGFEGSILACAAELAVNLCTEPGCQPGNSALAFLTAESPKL
ncbi:unnamed protein product [Rangifer tarandus platyrhynchus]|uniref:Uncharacterized protein n=2 Tax=Rangifer tarandus platyrhynchus TaxID=3082113 RepID=A0ACB0FLE7_RANTA|nr:unnamed protein product [Rangifer tarandus platyrhynchus]CAI9713593.1 unnamed protein product [Rangifer tarandus platyrhynchus]